MQDLQISNFQVYQAYSNYSHQHSQILNFYNKINLYQINEYNLLYIILFYIYPKFSLSDFKPDNTERYSTNLKSMLLRHLNYNIKNKIKINFIYKFLINLLKTG